MKLLLSLSALTAITSASNLAVRQADENATSTSDFADFSTATGTGIPLSVEQILLTAIPASLLSLAEVNPPSASALLASELANSATPAWYSALPTDIRSYLVVPATATSTITPTLLPHPSNVTIAPGPVITSRPTTLYNTTSVILPVFTTYANGSTVSNGTVIANNGTLVGGNGTSVGGNGTTAGGVGYNATTSGVGSTSLVPVVVTSGTGISASSTGASAVSSAATSSTATGGAAGVPTAVVGAGVVGVMGLLGMLVL